MRSIWKYVLGAAPGASCQDMPKDASVLHFAMQGDEACMWAEVDKDKPLEARTFIVVGTGFPLMDGSYYLGTTMQPPFVWHLYEYDERVEYDDDAREVLRIRRKGASDA